MLLKKPERDGGEELKKVFNLQELTCELKIEPEQLYAICDTYRGSLRISTLELTSIVANYIFINMGGTEKTSPEAVMGFMYLLLRTDNFNFHTIAKDIKTSLSSDNTFKYLSDNKVPVPKEFLVKMKNIIGLWLYEKLASRYTLLEEYDWPEEQIELFNQEVTSKTAAYVQGEGAIKNLNNLFEI